MTYFLDGDFVLVQEVVHNFLTYDTLQFRMNRAKQWSLTVIFDVEIAQLGQIDLHQSCYESTFLILFVLGYFGVKLKLRDVFSCQDAVHGKQITAEAAHRTSNEILWIHHWVLADVAHHTYPQSNVICNFVLCFTGKKSDLPGVGLWEQIPQKKAGILSDPATSLPIPQGEPPAARIPP